MTAATDGTDAAHRAVNLATILSQTAARLPDHDALVCGGVRLTWRALDGRVTRLALALRDRGIGPGDTVLVHSPNHIELVQTMFACWRAGAVFAPTNFRLTPADVGALAEICKPTALVCHADYPDHARRVRDGSTALAATLWIAAGPGDSNSVASASAGERSQRMTNAAVGGGDHAWYFFTSGTSGRPKAAVLTHEQMGFVITNHLCDLMPGTTESDVCMVVAPLSHGAGVHLLTQVARGARSVLPVSEGLDPSEAWRLVQAERVTNMFTVPTILKLLAEFPRLSEVDTSSLRYVIYAGAPMYLSDQERARSVLGEVLVQYYGLAEVTGNITVLPPHEHGRPLPDGMDIATCGYVRTGMQISVQDDTGAEMGAGTQGEICVAGPAVFAGYLENPDANREAFRDGWFRTGDLGMLDEHGYLYVTGRASDMYISGGSNIYPREIEEKLLRHPDLVEVAVLGLPDPTWGEIGVAVCVPSDGEALDVGAVRVWLEQHLARYKVPKRFVVWDELPKSGYGKIAKRTIRDRLLSETTQEVAP